MPITIQVFTGATLARLNATTLDDFLSYLPGVTAHGVGPGQNNIYMRGLGTGDFGNQAPASTALPNVAIYLDEQSPQLPGRNLDVYAADLERIEVLEGPQGTLFGAGAQAGVLRYITNKPKLDVTEASVSAGYATHRARRPEHRPGCAPQCADHRGHAGAARCHLQRAARRLHRQHPGHLCAHRRRPEHRLRGRERPGLPANSVVINNAALVAPTSTRSPTRACASELLYQFNEDWSALLAQSYQNIDAAGVFAEMAYNSLGQPQPDLTVQLFNPSYNKDRFENTALTIEGRLGALQVLYAGTYLVRNVEQVQDYTSYAHIGTYVDYYQCVNPKPGNPAAAQCFTPSAFWRDLERNTHQSHELRLSTPDELAYPRRRRPLL